MALHAADVDLEPAQALFGHLDVRARGGTGVRHDVEIVSTQETLSFGESRVALQHMGQAVVVAAFLVGHEHQAQAEFGGDVAGMQGFGQQQHAHQALLVVLHTASDEHVALPDHLPGIGMPQGRVTGRHHVHVGKKPERPGGTAGDAGHHVGAQPGGHARIGGIQTADVAHPAGAQAVFDIQGLGQLPRRRFPGPGHGRRSGRPEGPPHGPDADPASAGGGTGRCPANLCSCCFSLKPPGPGGPCGQMTKGRLSRQPPLCNVPENCNRCGMFTPGASRMPRMV